MIGLLAARSPQPAVETQNFAPLLNALRRDESQSSVADTDLVVVLKWVRLGDLPPVDEGAVARKIVFDQAPPVAVDDDSVRPADSFVLDLNVAHWVGSDPIVSRVNAKVFAVGVVAESDKPADDAPLGFAQWRGLVGQHHRAAIQGGRDCLWGRRLCMPTILTYGR
jgi:hypothetical protein